MLNCPFNSHLDFTQYCLIQTFTQITLRWRPMLNWPCNSNPNFAWSGLIPFSLILHIYVKICTPTWHPLSTIPPHYEIFLGPRLILWNHWLLLFWTLCEPGWLSHLHSYLLACSEPKHHIWCYTCFSTSMSVYAAGLPSGHPSCKQWRAGSCDLGPISQQMSIHCTGKFKGVHVLKHSHIGSWCPPLRLMPLLW